MRTYRINCTDEADRVVATHAFSCRDDLAVLEKAKKLCANHGVDVWEGTRRVLWMHKGGAVRFENLPAPLPVPVDWLGDLLTSGRPRIRRAPPLSSSRRLS
jgi:hypothetical protein